jgi:predicted metal-dependent phosphotriesterase family hydrolase
MREALNWTPRQLDDYVLTAFRETLIRAGIDEAVLHTISVDNPHRLLTGE